MKFNKSLFLILFSVAANLIADINEGGIVYQKNAKDWYNRRVGSSMAILNLNSGHPELALEQAERQGKDAEAEFVKSIAFAMLGDQKKAMESVKKSIELGLPIGRYQTNFEIIKPLLKIDRFRRFIDENASILVHGPMVGYTTDSSAKIWLRTAKEADTQIEFSEDKDFKKSILSDTIKTNNETEFTAKIDINNLKANTAYYYRLHIDGKLIDGNYEFKTFPEEGKSTEFNIAFGGCAAYIPWHSYMWSTIDKHRPAALLLLGDNVYIDYPLNQNVQRYCYNCRESEPEYRNLIAKTPILAVWDDHDFGNDDQIGGKDIEKPSWKRKNYEVFKNQFANPYFGGGDNNPGVWFNFKIADVEVFMLDGRYYREKSSPNASMLGKKQLEWLKSGLINSKAKFKVIASGVPWAYGAKPNYPKGGNDTWEGYPEEREEIFNLIAENKIPGVILLSADRHRSDLWLIPRPKAYDLYDMECSKLTNVHTHKSMKNDYNLFSYNDKCCFAKLVFNTSDANPYVRYEIWNLDNEKVFEFTQKLSDLTCKK